MENITDVLSHFEIEHEVYDNRIAFACPIHGGDNPNGLTISLQETILLGIGDAGLINVNKNTNKIYLVSSKACFVRKQEKTLGLATH